MFFLWNAIWGGLLMASVWFVDHAHFTTPAWHGVLMQIIAFLFAVPMSAMMLFRLNDLRWPRSLVVPTCVLYVGMSAGQLLDRPLLLGKITTAVLGLYSGLLYLALTFPILPARSGE
jgi:hypothetical protein